MVKYIRNAYEHGDADALFVYLSRMVRGELTGDERLFLTVNRLLALLKPVGVRPIGIGHA